MTATLGPHPRPFSQGEKGARIITRPLSPVIDTSDTAFLRSFANVWRLLSRRVTRMTRIQRVGSDRLLSLRAVVPTLINPALFLLTLSCRSDGDSQSLRPRQLRDVPASR